MHYDANMNLEIKHVEVNVGSSFKYTMSTLYIQLYIPSLNVIGLLVLEMKMFKCFTIYGRGSRDCYATKTTLTSLNMMFDFY